MRLTKSELEIMEVLWAADEPLCRADIIARSQDKTWKDSSVHILLNSMLKKEAIQEAGFVRRGKGYGRVFTLPFLRKPTLPATCSTGKTAPNCLGCSPVWSTAKALPPPLLDELEEMLQARRKELDK